MLSSKSSFTKPFSATFGTDRFPLPEVPVAHTRACAQRRKDSGARVDFVFSDDLSQKGRGQ